MLYRHSIRLLNITNLLKTCFFISLLIFLLLVEQKSSAQLHPILDKFDAYELNGSVYLDYVISSGSTCNGIDVMRSEDTINYIKIGYIDGVCGSPLEAVSYNFIDKNPIKNKTNYYKLKLGELGYTSNISVLIIDTKELGYQIRPNPANETAIIYFKNSTNNEYTIDLINNLGVNILVKKTNQDFFLLDLIYIPSGVYSFKITNNANKNKLSGKIIVQH